MIRFGLGEIGAVAVGGELGAGEEEATGKEDDGEEVDEEDQEEGADMGPLRWSLRHCDHRREGSNTKTKSFNFKQETVPEITYLKVLL